MYVAEKNCPEFRFPPGEPGRIDLLLEFASRQRLRTYRPRQVVLQQSDRTDHVLIVLSGWAEQAVQLADARRQILSLAMPGDLCCGDIGSHARMDHSITALTPLTIAIVGKFEFRALMSGHARLARSFWRNQMLTLSIQRRWTAILGQMGAMERISHLMCELLLRQQRLGLATGSSCAFPLTQTQVAEACGLTQVHTNRVIQDLRRRKLVEVRNKRLTVMSVQELSTTAGFDPSYLDLAGPDPAAAAEPAPPEPAHSVPL